MGSGVAGVNAPAFVERRGGERIDDEVVVSPG